MGYVTSYTLKVEQLTGETQTQTLTLNEAMEKVNTMKNVNKDEVLKLLQRVQAGDIALTAEDIIAQLREENSNARYCLDANGETQESGKWYESKADLQAFSARYPGWLFTLEGAGEESGDLWRCYFYEGKTQMAQAVITYEMFDKTKLSTQRF